MNFIFEAYHLILHMIKSFLGIGSNYHMRYHKRRKLTERLNKCLTVNYRATYQADSSESEPNAKYPYSPQTQSNTSDFNNVI